MSPPPWRRPWGSWLACEMPLPISRCLCALKLPKWAGRHGHERRPAHGLRLAERSAGTVQAHVWSRPPQASNQLVIGPSDGGFHRPRRRRRSASRWATTLAFHRCRHCRPTGRQPGRDLDVLSSPARRLRRLDGHPGQADLIGIVARPGVLAHPAQHAGARLRSPACTPRACTSRCCVGGLEAWRRMTARLATCRTCRHSPTRPARTSCSSPSSSSPAPSPSPSPSERVRWRCYGRSAPLRDRSAGPSWSRLRRPRDHRRLRRVPFRDMAGITVGAWPGRPRVGPAFDPCVGEPSGTRALDRRRGGRRRTRRLFRRPACQPHTSRGRARRSDH